jgi:hypothetical protein
LNGAPIAGIPTNLALPHQVLPLSFGACLDGSTTGLCAFNVSSLDALILNYTGAEWRYSEWSSFGYFNSPYKETEYYWNKYSYFDRSSGSVTGGMLFPALRVRYKEPCLLLLSGANTLYPMPIGNTVFL